MNPYYARGYVMNYRSILIVCLATLGLAVAGWGQADGMKIAFSARNEQGDEEVWVVDIDGSNLVNLTDGLGGDYPAWQPVVPSATATSVEAQSWGRIKALLSTGPR